MASKCSNQRIEITVQRGSGQKFEPKVSIFAAIDTSSSMKGKKIEQAIKSLKRIIQDNEVPQKAKITVRKFNTTVDTIVARTKHNIDLNRLEKSLKDCKGSTALYDAFGQTISEIPYEDIKTNDHIHIIVLTDGEDNSSKVYKLKEIADFLNKEVKGKFHCTFIQAGTVPNNIISLAAKCTSKNFSLISVDDTSEGIKLGLEKAQNSLQEHLKVIIETNRSVNENELAEAIKASLAFAGTGTNNSSNPAIGQNCENSIWAANIPYFANTLDITNYFRKWGNCKISKIGKEKSGQTQWAIISYGSKMEMMSALTNAKNQPFLKIAKLRIEKDKTN